LATQTYFTTGLWFSTNGKMLVTLPTISSGAASIIVEQQAIPKPNITGFYEVTKFIDPPKNDTSLCYIGSLQFDGEYDDPLYDEDEWIFFYWVIWTFPADSSCIKDELQGPYRLACEIGGTTSSPLWGGSLEFLEPV